MLDKVAKAMIVHSIHRIKEPAAADCILPMHEGMPYNIAEDLH